MKLNKISSAIILSLSSFFTVTTYAVAVPNGAVPGFYLGGQYGWSELNYNANSFTNGTSISISNTGYSAGRAYIGYQLNHYWGAEAGFTDFSNAKVKSLNGNTNIQGTISENAYDLVIRGTYPLVDSGFNIYGKAGGAYVRKFSSPSLCTYGQCNANQGLFTAGGGATYNIWPNVPVDFSWMTIFSRNNNIGTSNLASIGIAYYFG